MKFSSISLVVCAASKSAAAVNSLASSDATISTNTPTQSVRMAWETVRGGSVGSVEGC